MKKLLDLEGFIPLNRKQQSTIFGGDPIPSGDGSGGAGGGSTCDRSITCNSSIECEGCDLGCDWHPNGEYKVCWN